MQQLANRTEVQYRNLWHGVVVTPSALGHWLNARAGRSETTDPTGQAGNSCMADPPPHLPVPPQSHAVTAPTHLARGSRGGDRMARPKANTSNRTNQATLRPSRHHRAPATSPRPALRRPTPLPHPSPSAWLCSPTFQVEEVPARPDPPDYTLWWNRCCCDYCPLFRS